MMLALIRPDSWNFPLFLHILGATVLFGTVATVAIAGFASRSHAGYEQLLARVAARTFLFGVSRLHPHARRRAVDRRQGVPGRRQDPGWVDVGFIVSEPGALLLLITGILSRVSARRGALMLAVPVLAGIYVVALASRGSRCRGKPSRTTTSCGGIQQLAVGRQLGLAGRRAGRDRCSSSHARERTGSARAPSR